MKAEAQRIAIAEFCGLLKRPVGQLVEYQRWDEQVQGVFQRVKFQDRTSPCYIEGIPNYLRDLNAMHEAESKLSDTRDNDQWSKYCVELNRIACRLACGNTHSCGYTVAATAAQRAEALLRTIGKWVDERDTPQKGTK